MSLTKTRKNYFGKEILVLKIFGLSLTGNESLAYKIYSFLILSTTVFMYPFLAFYEYFKHDVSAIPDIIDYQAGTIIVLYHVVVVLRNRIKFGKLLAKLEQEPFIPNLDRGGQVEEELVGKCVRITSSQTMFCWGSACVFLTSAMIYTLVRRITSNDYHDWQVPFGLFTFFNVTYSPSYEINCLYQSFSIVFMAGQCLTIELLLAAVLAHIAYQCKMLQNFLKRMGEHGHKNMMELTNGLQHKSSNSSNFLNNSGDSDVPWEYLNKSSTEAVRYHVAIIDVAQEIEDVFSDMLLFTFLATTTLLCFFTYAGSSAGSLQSTGKHLVEGCIGSMLVAFVCFWGEQVFQESQLVAEAAYESDFVGTDLRFQKMLVFIIRRSQNPIKITAGKFTDIRLATLVWILRTSYSAFMVLRESNL